MKTRALWAALGALLLPPAVRGQTATARPAGLPSGHRDVLVLVVALPGGQEQVGLNYPNQVSRAQVQRDLGALQAETGRSLSHVKISDAPGVGGKVTGVTCDAAGLIRPETHGLEVESFVRALRPYPNLILTYFVGQGFEFKGLRDFSDAHVRIRLDQHGAAYTYQIQIQDPHFRRLNLPYLQPVGVDPASVRSAESARRRHGWLLALVAALAVGTGGIVYAVLARSA